MSASQYRYNFTLRASMDCEQYPAAAALARSRSDVSTLVLVGCWARHSAMKPSQPQLILKGFLLASGSMSGLLAPERGKTPAEQPG